MMTSVELCYFLQNICMKFKNPAMHQQHFTGTNPQSQACEGNIALKKNENYFISLIKIQCTVRRNDLT